MVTALPNEFFGSTSFEILKGRAMEGQNGKVDGDFNNGYERRKADGTPLEVPSTQGTPHRVIQPQDPGQGYSGRPGNPALQPFTPRPNGFPSRPGLQPAPLLPPPYLSPLPQTFTTHAFTPAAPLVTPSAPVLNPLKATVTAFDLLTSTAIVTSDLTLLVPTTRTSTAFQTLTSTLLVPKTATSTAFRTLTSTLLGQTVAASTAFQTLTSTAIITSDYTLLVPTTATTTLISTVTFTPPAISSTTAISTPISSTTVASILTSVLATPSVLALPSPLELPTIPPLPSSVVQSSTLAVPSVLTSSSIPTPTNPTNQSDTSTFLTGLPTSLATAPTFDGISSTKSPASNTKTDFPLIAAVTSAFGILLIGLLVLCCLRKKKQRRSAQFDFPTDEERLRAKELSLPELADTGRKIPEVRVTSLDPVVTKPKDAVLSKTATGLSSSPPNLGLLTKETASSKTIESTHPASSSNQSKAPSIPAANVRASDLGRFRFSGFPQTGTYPKKQEPWRPETLRSVASGQEYPIFFDKDASLLEKEDVANPMSNAEQRSSLHSDPGGRGSPAPQFHKKYNVDVSVPNNSQAVQLNMALTSPSTPSVFNQLQKISTTRSSVTLVPGSQYTAYDKVDRTSMTDSARSVNEEELDRLVCKIAPLTPSVIGSSSVVSQSLYGGPKHQLDSQILSPSDVGSWATTENFVLPGIASPKSVVTDMTRSVGRGSFVSGNVETRRESSGSAPRYREMGSWVSDQGKWITTRGDSIGSAR